MMDALQNITEIAQALSDDNRVRALMALRKQELCVCQLIDLLDLAPSTTSKHMTILKQAGLVATRKEGRWVYYRIAESSEGEPAYAAIQWVFENLGKSTQVREDDKKLREILSCELEEICCRIRG